jgi:DNA-binding CsgD family transcriptional regulator
MITSLSEKQLTAREIGIIQLVADGLSNREVGERLHLSPLTIKSHLARITQKLGNGSRAAQVAIAWRRGLLR